MVLGMAIDYLTGEYPMKAMRKWAGAGTGRCFYKVSRLVGTRLDVKTTVGMGYFLETADCRFGRDTFDFLN